MMAASADPEAAKRCRRRQGLRADDEDYRNVSRARMKCRDGR